MHRGHQSINAELSLTVCVCCTLGHDLSFISDKLIAKHSSFTLCEIM